MIRAPAPAALALLLAAPLAAPVATPLAAQEVAGCDPAPTVAHLVEPWEETSAVLAGGAVRLALLEGESGTRRLLVLTLPVPAPVPDPAPVEVPAEAPAAPEDGSDVGEAPDATVASDPTAPPPERRCRIVTEGGLGFADLDLAGLEAAEDAQAGTLTLRIPSLGFVPESSELTPHTLVLTFGVADESLAAAVE